MATMANLEQAMDAIGGAVSLVAGVNAIATRRIEVSEEGDYWLYGWRAIVAGCVGVLASVVMFASAADF